MELNSPEPAWNQAVKSKQRCTADSIEKTSGETVKYCFVVFKTIKLPHQKLRKVCNDGKLRQHGDLRQERLASLSIVSNDVKLRKY